MRVLSAVLLLVLVETPLAQVKRSPPRSTSATAAKNEPAQINCPAELGEGVRTGRMFCDVMTGRDPVAGAVVRIPPHTGDTLLSFDLHNRHTYSEEQVRAKRAFARYTATIGILSLDNVLISRAVVESEFRGPQDLFDRIAGGAPPEGLKAVAPTGLETVVVTIPASVSGVSILGEKLEVIRVDGRDMFTAPGRPVATISNVRIEYKPGRPQRRLK